MSEYTAIIKQSGKWWIGWIEEVPGVNCQESTREELLETLRITLGEAFGDESFRRAQRSIGRFRRDSHRRMKRRALERWLQREGGRHSWFINPATARRSAVPRHAEIDDDLVRKICRDLGIAAPRHT